MGPELKESSEWARISNQNAKAKRLPARDERENDDNARTTSD